MTDMPAIGWSRGRRGRARADRPSRPGRHARSCGREHYPHPPCRISAAPLALASTRWRVQISHFGAVQVRPGVSAFWWRSCLAVPGRAWRGFGRL